MEALLHRPGEARAAKIAQVVLFLALIRCIGEVFRLQFLAATDLTYSQITPFLLGAMLAAVALLAMILLSFRQQNRAVITLAVLTVGGLLLIKVLLMS